MSVIPTVLRAIVRLNGEAIVLHVGERPYVVTPTGQVDLASRSLTVDAVAGVVSELLPLEAQFALQEVGAAQHELPPSPDMPGERFTAVAAQGGSDIWLEIRRRQVVAAAPQIPADAAAVQVVPAVAANRADRSPAPAAVDAAAQELPRTAAAPSADVKGGGFDIVDIAVDGLEEPPARRDTVGEWEDISLNELVPAETAPAAAPSAPAPLPLEALAAPAAESRQPAPAEPGPAWPASATGAAAPPPVRHPTVVTFEAPMPAPAVVLPLARSPIRADVPPPVQDQGLSSLDSLLRLAAARGASSLYLSSGAPPAIRVDGEVQTLEGAPVLEPNEVESLLLTLMPERSAEALRSGVASEWIYDMPDLGRLRCMSFRDHRGPGGVFRMMPTRPISADQLGLSRQIQALAVEPEGVLLVAGPRSSGKRTLMSAWIDLINRARHDHVITIETEINVVHERDGSFVSQREVHGSHDEMLAAARAARRENPDVLVLEEVRTPELMNLALDAAASGQLVIAGFTAPSASGAIDRIIDLYPPEQRRQVQLSLAQNLRGVVAQVLLRKTSGGRVAAREVLLNTPAVRSVLAEGKTSQLPLAIEGGRVHGMAPLNDALVGYVQAGIVDVREAYRRAADRAGFLALLKRQGLDTSALERYA